MRVITNLKYNPFLRGLWFSMKGTGRYYIRKCNYAQYSDNVKITPPSVRVIPIISILAQMYVLGQMHIFQL